MVTLLKRVLWFLRRGPSFFHSPDVRSCSVQEKLSTGHGGDPGSPPPPLGQHFTAQLCYDVENEFPDPQVHLNGNKILKETCGSSLQLSWIPSSARLVNPVPVLETFRLVATVGAL